jgi:ribosomal protein S20
MKTSIKKVLAAVGTFAILGGAVVLIPIGNESFACGYNNAGGQAYAPQQRGTDSAYQKSIISQDKAVEIVSRHIKQLNPDLQIGNVNDAGPLYEAEILSSKKEILQVIGVYKHSGQMVIIN